MPVCGNARFCTIQFPTHRCHHISGSRAVILRIKHAAPIPTIEVVSVARRITRSLDSSIKSRPTLIVLRASRGRLRESFELRGKERSFAVKDYRGKDQPERFPGFVGSGVRWRVGWGRTRCGRILCRRDFNSQLVALAVLEGSIEIVGLHMSRHSLAIKGVSEYMVVDRDRSWLHHVAILAPELIRIGEALRFVRDRRNCAGGKAGCFESH